MIQVSCRWIFPFVLFLLLSLAACVRGKDQAPAAPPESAKTEKASPSQAVAALKPTEGNKVAGKVTFLSQDGAIRIVADIEGLTPGKHGFHIHQTGDCSAPDASSAGGHFNPGSAPHGAPGNPPAQRHAGDLGNLEANAEGKAHYERVDQILSMGGTNSIVGKSVIVHAQPDDLSTQPTGNAGPRQACGVIQIGE
jgi:Cu-Zn family superoxide dismutase